MALADSLNVLSGYRNASFEDPPPTVADDYSRVAPEVPPSHLAGGLAEAFRSGASPPFGQMMSTLFSNSNGQQRAGILTQLLSAVGPSILSSGALSGLTGLFRGNQPAVTPDEANQVSPQRVEQLAEHAAKHDPSIIDQAGQFYAQHPTLVQALGAGSLALIMSHLSRRS